MKRCYECGEPLLEGAVFCLECGADLTQQTNQAASSLTNVLPFNRFSKLATHPPVAPAESEPTDGHQQLTLIIPQRRHRLEMTLTKQLYIGRGGMVDEPEPELNLAGNDEESASISRLHAVIQLTPEGIVLRDLDSTNGTLLNNYLLEPEKSYILNSGDEIHFGDLLVHILFD